MQIELKTNLDGILPEKIDFNYDEVRTELEGKLDAYKQRGKTTVENYKEHKNDRARLNDLIRAIQNKQKRVKDQLLAPMTNSGSDELSFVDKMKRLIDLVKDTSTILDSSIKLYESQKDAEKAKRINDTIEAKCNECFANTLNALPYLLEWGTQQFDRARNAWLNSSCSIESIEDEIDTKIDGCMKIHQTIEAMYANDPVEVQVIARNALVKHFDTTEVVDAVNAYKEGLKQAKGETTTTEETNINTTNQSGGKQMYTTVLRFSGSLEALHNLKEYLQINAKDLTFETVEACRIKY